MKSRTRVDKLLVERGLVESRERAQALLLAGKVFYLGQRVDKAGTQLPDDAALELRGNDCPWVSRGGLKLDGALVGLGLCGLPHDAVCVDVGASTGGFTDVLLHYGAQRVYALDVGRGQLHERLRKDPRVRVCEGINARYELRSHVPEAVCLAVMDVSFISVTRILASLAALLAPTREGNAAAALIMVKPQFELEARLVGKGGIVREEALRQEAVERVIAAAKQVGLEARARWDNEVLGRSGNRETFVHFVQIGSSSAEPDA